MELTSKSAAQMRRECEALSAELELARRDLADGSAELRASLDFPARTKAWIGSRPVKAALITLAAGALATRLMPVLLWRGRASLLSRFAGQLARGAAGMMLPFIVDRFTSRPHFRAPARSPFPLIPNNPTHRIIMNSLTLKGTWHETKGKLKQKYADLTDDDLLYEEGREEELLGRLQKKTGETKEAIRDIISSL